MSCYSKLHLILFHGRVALRFETCCSVCASVQQHEWAALTIRQGTSRYRSFQSAVAQSSVLNFADVFLHVSVFVLHFMMGVDMSYMPLWSVLSALTAATAFVKTVGLLPVFSVQSAHINVILQDLRSKFTNAQLIIIKFQLDFHTHVFLTNSTINYSAIWTVIYLYSCCLLRWAC